MLSRIQTIEKKESLRRRKNNGMPNFSKYTAYSEGSEEEKITNEVFL